MQVRLMKRHHPGTGQLDTRSAVHGPFDGFQLIDLSLCLQPWSNGAFPLSGVAGSWGPMGARSRHFAGHIASGSSANDEMKEALVHSVDGRRDDPSPGPLFDDGGRSAQGDHAL